MIQPVNALTPKVLFRGETTVNAKEFAKNNAKKNIAIVNATGISAILGAATTIIARSCTSSWRNAACFGIGTSLISMMFLVPGFLYKAGMYTSKQAEGDVFTKGTDATKKLHVDVGELSSSAKNTAKSTIKSIPKI